MNTSDNKTLTLLATCLGFVVVLLDVSVVNVALERFKAEFATDVLQLQWIVNAYTLFFASLLLTGGALGDRFGHKTVFLWGYAVFTLASLGCGLAHTLPILIGFRSLQGIGAALLVPTSLALVRIAYEVPAERSKAIALWAGVAGIALAAGPVVGGLLIGVFGWRSIFFINLPIGLIGIVLCMVNTPRIAPNHKGGFDLWGQILALFTLANLTYTVIELGREGGVDLRVIIHSLCFVLGLIGFIWVESRTARPMVPLSVFNNAAFSLASILGIIVNFVFYGLIFVFSIFLQQVNHYSVISTGLAFLPMTGVLFFGNQLAARWLPKLRERRLLALGLAIALLGVVSLWPFVDGAPYADIAVQMFVIGFGISLTVPTLTATAVNHVSSDKSGVASAIVNASRQVGGLIGVAIFSLLISVADASQFGRGFAQVIVLSSLLLAVGWALTLVLLRKQPLAVKSAT
ncbi:MULTISPECIES: MFS transporter [Klebsiella]|uniref:MFS transporter n=1 Tax=Klebsiella TaxID=570 RepID=UPI00026BB96F|nr:MULTISPECIES: MFS transporter [Klebsiella]AVE76617.1 MFS transporter [Klebsiella oxytoca]AFN33142.1 Permeases of the major facilitator superfamily [Klebsiella michiganensis E718]ASK72861.1 MFS transporter [Klebsiella michiganensis]ASZ57931.1 MFS transporter [Klebsiella michiganensis]MBG2658380.1 MFS transporter [Klebsiella michiganensis]